MPSNSDQDQGGRVFYLPICELIIIFFRFEIIYEKKLNPVRKKLLKKRFVMFFVE